ncbi:MAG: hypothetical protein ACYDCC_12100 [Actinomycetota bacterium]
MKRIFAVMLVTLCFPTGPALARKEPSTACAKGFVAPSDTPSGIGVRVTTDKGVATIIVCNSGSAVPDPGSSKLVVDTKSQSLLFVKSGDSTNTLTSCSKGFVGVKESGGTVAFYEANHGAYSSHSKAKSADQFATDLESDCTQ